MSRQIPQFTLWTVLLIPYKRTTPKQNKQKLDRKKATAKWWSLLKQTPLSWRNKGDFFFFSSGNIFHAPVCCRHLRCQSPAGIPTAPARWALHVLHLRAYLMQGSEVSYSLHLQKSHSSSPWLQHSCQMVLKVIPSVVVWMLQVVQQLLVTIFHHCHIGRTILYCKTPICYCQCGYQYTLKAKLVVSKFGFINLSKLTCLQNSKSQCALNWIISFRPGLAWLSVHQCFFENWFLADDHGCYKTVFKNSFIFEKNFPLLLYQPHA